MKTLGQVSFEHWFATGFFRWEDEDAEGRAIWEANAAVIVKADTEARAACVQENLGLKSLVAMRSGADTAVRVAKVRELDTERLTNGQAVTPRVTGNGATCKRCKEHYPYAEPVEGFTCYGCRNR